MPDGKWRAADAQIFLLTQNGVATNYTNCTNYTNLPDGKC